MLLHNIRKIQEEDQRTKDQSSKTIQFLLGSTVIIGGAMLLRYPREALTMISKIPSVGGSASDIFNNVGSYTAATGAFISHITESIYKGHFIENALSGSLSNSSAPTDIFTRAYIHARQIQREVVRGDAGTEPLGFIASLQRISNWQKAYRQDRNIFDSDPISDRILGNIQRGLYEHHHVKAMPNAKPNAVRDVQIADMLLAQRDKLSGKGFDDLLEQWHLGNSSEGINRLLDTHRNATARGSADYYRRLHGLSDEFVRGINELGGFGDNTNNETMAFIGKAIRAAANGTGTEKQQLAGKSFFELGVDSLTRIDQGAGRNLVDMRRAARSIETTRGFLHKNFQLPILKFNIMDVIMPSAPQAKGFQIHQFNQFNIPSTLAARLPGQDLSAGLTLLGDKLYHTANLNLGSPEPIMNDLRVIQKGAAREMLDSFAGRHRVSHRNYLNDVIQYGGRGSEALNAWEDFKDTWDLRQRRPSVFTNVISWLTKGQVSPQNMYPPTVLKHLQSLSTQQRAQFVRQMDQGNAFSEIYSYVESSLRGPIYDTKMDIEIGSMLHDIANGFKDNSDIGNQIRNAGTSLVSGKTHLSDVVRGGFGGKRSIMELLANDESVAVIEQYFKSRPNIGEQGQDLLNIVGLFRKHTKNTLESMYSDAVRATTISPLDNPQISNIYDRSVMALQRAVVTEDFVTNATGYNASSIDRMSKMLVLNKLAGINTTSRDTTSGGLMHTLIEQSDVFKSTSKMVSSIASKRGLLETGINPGTDWATAQWFDVEGIRSINPDLNLDVIKEATWNPLDFFIKQTGRTPTDFTNDINAYMEQAEKGFNWDNAKAYFKQFLPDELSQVTTGAIMPYRIASQLSHMMDAIGIGLGPRSYEHGPGGIMTSMLYNRALPMATGAMLYNYVDRELEAVSDEGLDDRISSTAAGSRLAMARFRDITGATQFTKFLYEALPGSEYIGKDLLGSIPGIGDYGLNLGLDESYEELSEFYSEGYVPVRSGRWWLASKTPWGGNNIAGWRPNWAVREEYNIDRTDEDIRNERLHSILPSMAFGPGFNPISPITALLDPYWKEKQYYDERPYPMTGSLFNPTTPGTGTANFLLGNLIKPRVRMHEDEVRATEGFISREYPRIYAEDATQMALNDSIAGGSYNVQEGGMTSGKSGDAGDLSRYTIGAMNKAAGRSYPAGGGSQIRNINTITPYNRTLGNKSIATYAGADIITTNNPIYQMGMSEYQNTELTGLRGYLFSQLLGNWGTSRPVLEESNIGNIEDVWWGENLGSGPMPFESLQEATELFRRFAPHKRSEVNYFNPIRNTQGSWMPSGATYFTDFQHGDPYQKTKVPGEGSIPGQGFENLWGEVLGSDFYLRPRASMLGYDFENQVKMLSGSSETGSSYAEEAGDIIHATIQANLRKAGFLIEEELDVRDKDTGITGHIDVIANFGRGSEVIEIKSLSQNRWDEMPSTGYAEHRSQLNFYLKTQSADRGYIYYTNRDDPSQTSVVPVDYDPVLLQEDTSRAFAAQREVARRIDMGVLSPYQPYSSAARAMSLAVTAPWSNEYLMERKQAMEQFEDDPQIIARLEKFNKMATMSRTRKQFTPYKYLGGKGFGFVVGEAWEGFAHMDTMLHTKFLPARSALEDYERSYMYGDDFGNWDHPWANWIEPTLRGIASKNPIYATGYAGTVGWMFGRNRTGALIGSSIGATIGATASGARSLREGITGKEWVPSKIRKHREIEEYFDMLNYVKWQSIYNATGHPLAEERLKATNIGMNPYDQAAIRAIPKIERPYLGAFSEETNENNRQTILELVSEPARRILEAQYGMDVDAPSQNPWEYFQHHYLPPSDWEGWDPSREMDDYKVVYLDHQGMDLHDFNMWPEDVVGARLVGAEFSRNINRPRKSSGGIQRTTEQTLHDLGVNKQDLFINARSDGSYNTHITVRKDVTANVASRIASGEVQYG